MLKEKRQFLYALAVFLLGLSLGITFSLDFAKRENFEEVSPQSVENSVEIPQNSIVLTDPETIEARGEETEDYIPFVEEVDGGLFEDKEAGISVDNEHYSDLGAIEYFDTSTPEAFENATIGKCIIENNIYGAQCVSLARAFWFSYAGRDVSTCGTGMAKGMMNCYAENAGDDFITFWSDSVNAIQSGDWLIFDGGKYGHVGMALSGVNNGYVLLLGENQGGANCVEGGSATNKIYISVKNLIGFYRPKAYVYTPPIPEELPETSKGL